MKHNSHLACVAGGINAANASQTFSTQTCIRRPASTRTAVLAIVLLFTPTRQWGASLANDAHLPLLTLLIVLSTFLLLLLHFLIYIPLLRRRRGIVLRDNYGPIDMSRGDLVQGEGGGL